MMDSPLVCGLEHRLGGFSPWRAEQAGYGAGLGHEQPRRLIQLLGQLLRGHAGHAVVTVAMQADFMPPFQNFSG